MMGVVCCRNRFHPGPLFLLHVITKGLPEQLRFWAGYP